MHLNTFFCNANIESTCHNFAKLNHKYMKVKHQLELLYFQADEGLVCMDIVSTFHILVNFGKFKQPTNLEHTFHPLFLYRNSSNFVYDLQ
jgi:hypothetical protein